MLHLAGYLELYAKKQPTRSFSNAGVVMHCLSTVVSFHVIDNQEISCTKGGMESG